jgi:ankyrin repeat protein
MNGLSPLHVAAHYNNLDALLILLENEANTKTAAKVKTYKSIRKQL